VLRWCGLYGTWSRQGQCLGIIGGLPTARGYVRLVWLVQVFVLVFLRVVMEL
jgi:hypothetical protein